MANLCYTLYRIAGEPERLNELSQLLHGISCEFPERERLVGLVTLLGGDPADFNCRGHWLDYDLKDDCLWFDFSSAWGPLIETWDWIADCIGGLKCYYRADESSDCWAAARPCLERGWFVDCGWLLEGYTPEGEEIYENFPDLDTAIAYIHTLPDGEMVRIEDDVDELSDLWAHINDDCFLSLIPFTPAE